MRSRHILQIGFATLIIVLIIFSGIGRSSISGTVNDSPLVINRTRSFEVIKASIDDNQLHLKLKNNYDKTITGFEISIGQEFTITEEFIFAEVSDLGIKPQAIYSKSYPLPSSKGQKPSFDITIKTVVLDDGSGDGDILAFEDIKAKRLGEEIQLRRTIETLDRFFERSQSDIGRLKSEIASALNASETDTLNRLLQINPTGVINRDSQKALPDSVKWGLHKGRENILRKMAEVKDQNTEVEKLMQVKETYERILTRL